MGVYRAAGLTEVNAAVQVKRWKGNIHDLLELLIRYNDFVLCAKYDLIFLHS
jgi:hypothetical protein